MFGFNCETFTSTCAGLFDTMIEEDIKKNPDEYYTIHLPEGTVKPNPMQRPIMEGQDPGKMKPDLRENLAARQEEAGE